MPMPQSGRRIATLWELGSFGVRIAAHGLQSARRCWLVWHCTDNYFFFPSKYLGTAVINV